MWQYMDLLKAENPEAYKKLAEKGVMIGFPAKIAGQSHRPDNGIPYHSTVKFFDPDKDKPEAIHDIASKLNLTPPDPKKTSIEPGQFKDRLGNDVYVIKLHGQHADEIKDQNAKFNHMGFPANFKYQPHVSVDKATWDKVVASKAKTAHEAGIEFGDAELRQGHNVLARYGQQEEKLAASEKLKVFKQVIGLSVDLSQHKKAIRLNDNFFKNYLQDNPGLEQELLKKHEERLKAHFGDNLLLIEIALTKGLDEAYKAKEGK